MPSTVKACVFDAYGTLFDVHSAVARYRGHLGDRADALSALWRSKQLEYTWLRSLMGRFVEFGQVTQEALDYAFDTYGIDDQGLRAGLLDAYLHLDCYPEVVETLRRLKQAGLPTVILSNGSVAMLKSAVGSAGIADLIDYNISVDEVGVYKPDPRVYQLAVDRLGFTAGDLCFMSANAWDAAGAACFGFRVAWINRSGQRPERLPCKPDVKLKSLAGLPGWLGL